MKKQLIMMACILMASIAAFAGTNSKILLQHEGGVKVYDSNQMTQALADAVKGDTIFLSEGTYSGFELTKEVTIRGSGEKTVISGDLKIAIAGTPVCSVPLLESLRITGYLYINKAIKKLHIRRCFFRYFTVNDKIEDALIDRCASLYKNGDTYYYDSFNLSTNIISMTVLNSKVYGLYGSYNTGSVTFVNCIIRGRQGGSGQNYINCILDNAYSNSSSYDLVNASLTNCLYNISTSTGNYNSRIGSSCQLVNCYAIDNGDNSLQTLTIEELTTNKYFGNEGTIVGPYGGNTPFVDSLAPAAPKVSDSSIALDLDNKKLNVSLKVTAE